MDFRLSHSTFSLEFNLLTSHLLRSLAFAVIMGDSAPFTASRVARHFELEEHPIDVTEKLRVIRCQRLLQAHPISNLIIRSQ
jgi:hypothetical protein